MQDYKTTTDLDFFFINIAVQTSAYENRLNIPMPYIPLCCRIVIVKLSKGETIHSIAEPKDLPLSTYDEVHRSPSASGAYVAEAFSR